MALVASQLGMGVMRRLAIESSSEITSMALKQRMAVTCDSVSNDENGPNVTSLGNGAKGCFGVLSHRELAHHTAIFMFENMAVVHVGCVGGGIVVERHKHL